MTPLHVQSDIRIMELLLKNGADPNIRDCEGMTALHCALYIEEIPLLLKWGADCNIRDIDGDLPEGCYGEEDFEKINLVKEWRRTHA